MTEKTEKKFYGMKNDYMFKAVLQENQDVLVNLVATLMRIPEKEIVSCKITNTIELGKSIDAKECVLDIRLVLNGNVAINIELQIDNEGNWPEMAKKNWHTGQESSRRRLWRSLSRLPVQRRLCRKW